MFSLFCFTAEIKIEFTGLWVDINVVVGLEVLKEVGVDLEV